MSGTRVERATLTAVLILGVGAMVADSAALSPVARVAPLVVGLPTVGLLIFEFVRDLMVRAPAPPDDGRAMPAARGFLVWLAALLVLTRVFGIVVGSATWLVLALRLRSRERWPIAIGLAAAFATVLAIVLVGLIGAPITAGALF